MKKILLALAFISSGASALGVSGKQEFIVSLPGKELRFINAGELMHVIESRVDPKSKRQSAVACSSSPLKANAGVFRGARVEFKPTHGELNGSSRYEYSSLMTNLASRQTQTLCALK